jgi:hypothetical protein
MNSAEDLIANPPFSLTEVDKATLRQTDEEFNLHTWTELKDIIGMLAFDKACTVTQP